MANKRTMIRETYSYTKRERSVDEINGLLEVMHSQIKRHQRNIEELECKVKELEHERDTITKQNPLAISVEEFVKTNTMNSHRRKHLGDLINKYWGNGVDQKHVTLGGKNIFDTVSEWLDENVENSDGIVCLMFPSLTLKMERREDLTEKEISQMINDPDAILVFSK